MVLDLAGQDAVARTKDPNKSGVPAPEYECKVSIENHAMQCLWGDVEGEPAADGCTGECNANNKKCNIEYYTMHAGVPSLSIECKKDGCTQDTKLLLNGDLTYSDGRLGRKFAAFCSRFETNNQPRAGDYYAKEVPKRTKAKTNDNKVMSLSPTGHGNKRDNKARDDFKAIVDCTVENSCKKSFFGFHNWAKAEVKNAQHAQNVTMSFKVSHTLFF